MEPRQSPPSIINVPLQLADKNSDFEPLPIHVTLRVRSWEHVIPRNRLVGRAATHALVYTHTYIHTIHRHTFAQTSVRTRVVRRCRAFVFVSVACRFTVFSRFSFVLRIFVFLFVFDDDRPFGRFFFFCCYPVPTPGRFEITIDSRGFVESVKKIKSFQIKNVIAQVLSSCVRACVWAREPLALTVRTDYSYFATYMEHRDGLRRVARAAEKIFENPKWTQPRHYDGT